MNIALLMLTMMGAPPVCESKSIATLEDGCSITISVPARVEILLKLGKPLPDCSVCVEKTGVQAT